MSIAAARMMTSAGSELLPLTMIRLAAHPADKGAAIAEAAQMLVAAGYVEAGYAESMVRREAVANTFLGNGVAIPHGLGEDRHLVRRNGLAILQVPAGVTWNEGQVAHLVVAIAAQSDTHITVLRRLTRLLQDSELLARLATTDDASLIAQVLGSDAPAPAAPAAAATDFAASFDWKVDYPTGLHARPAAAWVETARRFGAQLRVRHGAAAADPKNLISLLQLGLRAGETVTISADGPDADAALAALRATVTGLSAQEKADAALAATRAKQASRAGWAAPANLSALAGVPAAPGLAFAPLHVIAASSLAIPDRPMPLADGAALLQEALTHTRQQLQVLADDTARRLGAADAGIFKAQAELLADTDLITRTCQLMVDGHGVAWAWNAVIEQVAQELAGVGSPVLAARAADLRDVGSRVLGHIDPALKTGSLRDLPDEPCILVAADLSPSDTAGLDPARVVGIATAQGGPTSHTAILARTLGVPALVGGGAALLDLASGTSAILDGSAGRLYLEPDAEALASARAFDAARAAERAREEEARALPARTTDGVGISIGANINLPDQAAFALGQGAEGVGLMRTEFLFLERSATPSEDEQYAIYRAMSEALGGRQLIVRTLDIGGDKQVAHLNLPHEENPFLGVRGARLLLRRPDLLEPQLRALYRAAKDGADILIMFPMITSLGELLALRGISERIRAELAAPVVPVGIMIEVPAAAIQAESLARHADFFSIGTNDLTQYTLAIDRQNPQLAPEVDSLHPAVLRLIKATVDGARAHGRWVGVCGGIAGEPFGAALLAGLGCGELSMTPREIPGVKARLRATSMNELTALAEKALACASAEEVRALDGGAA